MNERVRLWTVFSSLVCVAAATLVATLFVAACSSVPTATPEPQREAQPPTAAPATATITLVPTASASQTTVASQTTAASRTTVATATEVATPVPTEIQAAAPIETPAELALSSAAFAAEGDIPAEYTCDGADRSPELAWDGAPEGVRSWALVCEDPDAPGGTFIHWVLYDLPAELRSLPAGTPGEEYPAVGGTHGRNDFGELAYGGPCPPSGTHRYYFRLYALDTLLDLEPGATRAELEQAMAGHILGEAELMGRYRRQ